MYERLRREAEAILDVLTLERALEVAAENGVAVYEKPIVVERGIHVDASGGEKWSYAYAYVRMYMPFYIVTVRMYTDGAVTVTIGSFCGGSV